MNTNELKPCPFCGGEAEHLLDQTTEQNHSVNCKKCCFSISRFYHGNSYLDKWNTRHAPDVDWDNVLCLIKSMKEPETAVRITDYTKGYGDGFNKAIDEAITKLENAVKGEHNEHA